MPNFGRGDSGEARIFRGIRPSTLRLRVDSGNLSAAVKQKAIKPPRFPIILHQVRNLAIRFDLEGTWTI